MGSPQEVFKAWKDAGGPIWAWNRDGVLVLTTVREMWEQYWDDHPELSEEFARIFNE